MNLLYTLFAALAVIFTLFTQVNGYTSAAIYAYERYSGKSKSVDNTSSSNSTTANARSAETTTCSKGYTSCELFGCIQGTECPAICSQRTTVSSCYFSANGKGCRWESNTCIEDIQCPIDDSGECPDGCQGCGPYQCVVKGLTCPAPCDGRAQDACTADTIVNGIGCSWSDGKCVLWDVFNVVPLATDQVKAKDYVTESSGNTNSVSGNDEKTDTGDSSSTDAGEPGDGEDDDGADDQCVDESDSNGDDDKNEHNEDDKNTDEDDEDNECEDGDSDDTDSGDNKGDDEDEQCDDDISEQSDKNDDDGDGGKDDEQCEDDDSDQSESDDDSDDDDDDCEDGSDDDEDSRGNGKDSDDDDDDDDCDEDSDDSDTETPTSKSYADINISTIYAVTTSKSASVSASSSGTAKPTSSSESESDSSSSQTQNGKSESKSIGLGPLIAIIILAFGIVGLVSWGGLYYATRRKTEFTTSRAEVHQRSLANHDPSHDSGISTLNLSYSGPPVNNNTTQASRNPPRRDNHMSDLLL